MKYILILLISTIITGCAIKPNTKNKQEVIINSKTKEARVYPQDKDMLMCQEFSIIKYGTFKEIHGLRKIDAEKLELCKTKHKALADYIDELKSLDK